MLFYVHFGDECNDTVRCNQAAAVGAIGCLLYNSGGSIGLTVVLTCLAVNLNLQDQRLSPLEVLVGRMV